MQMLAWFAIPEYWIVDPVANTLEIYTVTAGGHQLVDAYDEGQDVQSPTLPGLSFSAGRLFEE